MMDTKRWVQIVQEQIGCAEHAGAMRNGKESRAWVAGEGQYNDDDTEGWESDVVRSNLWYRDIKTMAANVMGQEPRIVVSTIFSDDVFQRACTAITAMCEKTAKETKLFVELEAAYLTAKHDNVGFVKLHWDPYRQLPTFRWVEGEVVMDKYGFGMMNRARWVAEVVKRPLSEVLQDISLPKKKRDELRKHFTSEFGKIDYDRQLTFYYIWSKDGAHPWKEAGNRQLIIICTDWQDDLILETDWPWPFLDHDDFPIKMLRLEWVPGLFEGITPFQITKPLLKQHNWLNSFLQASIRREVTKKILADDTIKDKDALTSGKHMQVVEVNANDGVKKHVDVIDFTNGPANNVIQALSIVKAQHDEETGVTDIVRGQSPGSRVTATEARALERNSSTVAQYEGSTVDRFYDDCFSTLALAILYYVPQWSTVTRGGVAVSKEWDPNQINPEHPDIPGMWIELPIDPLEAAKLRPAERYEDGFILRPGVDAFVGDDHASAWLKYDLEQLRRDFSFCVESGSSRMEYTAEKERTAMTLVQVGIPLMERFQCFDQVWEIWRNFVLASRIPNPHRYIPDRVKFQTGPVNFESQSIPGEGDSNVRPDQQPPERALGMSSGPGGLEANGRSEMFEMRNESQ